jgi:hypothetical protein
MSKLALTLTINGERHEVLTEPHRTLDVPASTSD